MAKGARPRPAKLGEKLKQIRMNLGFSQTEMLKTLGLEGKANRSLISGFELGTKEPSLIAILKYARLAGVSTDVLIDDGLELSQQLNPVKNR